MNTQENTMVSVLKKLRSDFGVSEVKMEFEAEATRLNEAMRLKEIADRAGVGFVVKIGGGEAITDMFDAMLLGASGIIAPMLETQYAVTKYIGAIEKYFSKDLQKNTFFGINLETFTGYQNLDAMFAADGFEKISTLTFGRVDFIGSLGLTRDQINSDIVLRFVESTFRKAKTKNLRTTVGGGISVDALPFLDALIRQKLVDRYETRKIVFETKKFTNSHAKEGILLAVEFELMWLENKKNYYAMISHEDDKRIEMIKRRSRK